MGNMPDSSFEQARKEWFERMGEPIVERNRWFLVALVLAVGLAASISTNTMLLPLKTVVPYVINVNEQTGEAKPSSVQAQGYKAGIPEKKYFLAKWLRQIITIDPAMTEPNLREAFTLVRGKAVQEYTDFMNQTKPLLRLRDEKTLTRQPGITTVDFLQEHIANIRFVAEERQAGAAPVIKRYSAIVHFEIVQPATEREILQNPIGMFITHFAITEEIN